MATSGKNPLMGNKDTQKTSPAGKKSGGQGSGGHIPADRQKAPDAGKKGGTQGSGGGTRKA
ncbi:general stress protein [Pseudomonas chlororaphis]|uniref:general stress protein n=1 Tax=Pseudomonas chlororaphis TaxID=587753 RepID=UPI002407C9C8|nr:general stress protein [Pseudomonas chlororaphis]